MCVSSTYSIKQDSSETVKFIPASCALSLPPSMSQLSQWQLVFVNLDSNTHFHAMESCQRLMKQKSASKTTIKTVASFYPLNFVWLQNSGLSKMLFAQCTQSVRITWVHFKQIGPQTADQNVLSAQNLQLSLKGPKRKFWGQNCFKWFQNNTQVHANVH